MVNEEILNYAQFGRKFVFFPQDAQNLILKENVSPTGEREVIIKDRQIINKWLPPEIKVKNAIEYIKKKGWVLIDDKNLKDKLGGIRYEKISVFLANLVEKGTLKVARFGHRKIYFTPDTKNLVLKKDGGPTGEREVILKEGKITDKWLPNEIKKQNAVDYIMKKGWVNSSDKNLKSILGNVSNVSASDFLKDVVKQNILKVAQFGNNKFVYFTPDTKNLILKKDESPTKKREEIVVTGKITDNWLAPKIKRKNAVEYIKNEGWTHLGDKKLKKLLGNIVDGKISVFLIGLAKEGTLKYAQRGNKKIYFIPDTQNLIIDKDKSPTKKREEIVINGKITDIWQPMYIKRKNAVKHIKEMGWTHSGDKKLRKKLGCIGSGKISVFLAELVEGGTLFFGEFGTRKIYFTPKTQNLILFTF